MMRQTKATAATWGVAGILAAGLCLFGCGRQPGHMEQGEHGHDTGHMEHQEGEYNEGGEPGHGSDSHHKHDEIGVSESMHEQTPTGTLSDGVRSVTIKARKFEFAPATVVVKQGEKVRLRVTSEDVTHGIGIADFEIDKKLPPNETVVIEFTADKPGTHHFHCSVYCGKGHGDMHGELVVRRE